MKYENIFHLLFQAGKVLTAVCPAMKAFMATDVSKNVAVKTVHRVIPYLEPANVHQDIEDLCKY